MEKQGFTLVEVIVVSLIVAILALTSVQVYMGYVNDSRDQMVEGAAASAATYLNAAANLGNPVPGSFDTELSGSDTWVTYMGGGDSSLFRAPSGITITIDGGTNSVSASMDGHTSSAVRYQ